MALKRFPCARKLHSEPLSNYFHFGQSVYLCVLESLYMTEQILILDFGSQYTQLIARRVRELNVYCEIHPYNNFPELTPNIKGVILSGSPCSVRDENAPAVDLDKFRKV